LVGRGREVVLVTQLHGIDVSYAQGVIDWRSVATTSPALDFVMARMTHGGHGDYDLRVDRRAAANKAGMRQWFPGAARGYYHFLGTSTPAVQAAHFRSVTGDLQPGEFLVLDVEPDAPARVPVLSVTHIVATLEAIEREFALTPFLYIGHSYSGSRDSRLWRFPLMFPAYISEARMLPLAAQMGRPVVVWQWGGADVAGIAHAVDANEIRDHAAFRAALEPAPAPPHTPDTNAPPAPVGATTPTPEEPEMPKYIVAESQSHGSALVTTTLDEAGNPHYSMRGFNDPQTAEAWGAAYGRKSYSDGEYEALAAGAD
jgi:GH25 family lysozyme M1 (1,4-beta-N-acetylmuramidase)